MMLQQTIRFLAYGIAFLIGFLTVETCFGTPGNQATPDPYFRAPKQKQPTRELSSDFKPLRIPGRPIETPQVERAPYNQPMTRTGALKPINSGKTSFEKPIESRESFEPGKVLALVGGEPVFVGDLLFEAHQLVEQHMPTAPPEIKAKQRKELIPRLLPKFVESKLLFMGATRELPEQVDLEKVIEEATKEFDKKALPDMMKSSGVTSIAEFDAQLRGQGSSLRSLKRSWSIEQLTKLLVSQKIAKTPEVTHRELLKEYQTNLAKYEFPAKAKWEQILIRIDKAGSREAAETKARELTKKIVGGANFAALAKKESHGFRRSSGGQHDWTTKGALVAKNIDDAIFTLPVGKLSGILESEQGLHIVRVIERAQAGRTPFVEAQVEIKQQIVEKRRRKAFAEFLEKCREEIPVEYVTD